MKRIWFVIELANLVTGFCSMADSSHNAGSYVCYTDILLTFSV